MSLFDLPLICFHLKLSKQRNIIMHITLHYTFTIIWQISNELQIGLIFKNYTAIDMYGMNMGMYAVHYHSGRGASLPPVYSNDFMYS